MSSQLGNRFQGEFTENFIFKPSGVGCSGGGPTELNYAIISKATEEKYARVVKERHPCVYDTTALSLKVGDIIRIKSRPITGMWRGELILENGVNGKSGWFPFTHVELLDAFPKLCSDRKE